MMDHSNMAHSSDMEMEHDTCSMNMLFTWSYKNTCVVFSWWHIRTLADLLFSFIALVGLSYLYEYLKYRIYKSQLEFSENQGHNVSNINPEVNKRNKITNSCLYGLQVGYSFMLMLVFMTYNGWLMIAVVLGAVWGHYSWGSLIEQNFGQSSLACH